LPERTHYSKAPIIEAIIDLRVVARYSLVTEDLLSLHQLVTDNYPVCEEEHTFSGEVQFQDMGEPLRAESSRQVTGFRFVSEDRRRSVLARPDQFVFSLRAPYDNWDDFRDEAYRIWSLYHKIAEPKEVTRLALRYINRIDIPSTNDVARLEEYLNTYPEAPEEPLNMSLMTGFFMQLQLWQQDLECWLIINEAPDVSPAENVLSIRLDFDLFRESFDKPWSAKDSTVWDFIERLHIRKNEVFEASITDETRELIR
jgi:uncharacterized protein (TIGR04255 family)